MALPSLTPEQRQAALEKAAAARRERAEVKNRLKHSGASLAEVLHESKDNEVTIVVSSYDFEEDKDINLFVKGTSPGKYTMAKAPKRAAPPSPPPATNVPKDD